MAPRFTVLKPLGSGNFGSVNFVFDPEIQKSYVVKELRMAHWGEYERLCGEVEVELAQSLSHAYVVPFLGGCFDGEHKAFIKVALCSGGSLQGRIQEMQGQHLPEEQLKYWLAQLLLGTKYLHDSGVLHRDLKAANILLTGKGDIQIADLGVATYRRGGGEEDHHPFGDPVIQSPEMLAWQKYSYPSDVWCAAKLLNLNSLVLNESYIARSGWLPRLWV